MLTELLVAMGMGLAIFGAAVTLFSAFAHQKSRSESQVEAQDGARKVVDRIATQLRSAMAGSTTSNQPIESHSSYDIVALVPLPSASVTANPRGVTHVRYCLDASDVTNEVLWLQTVAYNSGTQATPPANGSCPSSAWPNQQQVASGLVNQLQSPAKPLFTTTTDSSGNVSDVALNAVFDADPSADPPATSLQSSVTLRNLNRSPTASLTCQAQGNGHAICDASASSDPEAQTLTYSWQMDGSLLAATSYHLDQSGLSSNSTHTFTVTVTDSGSLTSTASQSVHMP
jgi:hypothetical protein